jgi:hypothetical protein
MLRAHHEGTSSHDPVDLGLALVGAVEHPGVQPLDWSVAERLVGRLARTGDVAVGRDRDVAEDPVAWNLRPAVTTCLLADCWQASHLPMVSQPGAVTRLIVAAARNTT